MTGICLAVHFQQELFTGIRQPQYPYQAAEQNVEIHLENHVRLEGNLAKQVNI
jgi:hypothetical protein